MQKLTLNSSAAFRPAWTFIRSTLVKGNTMNEATIPTWNLLPSLGFRPDSTVHFSEVHPGLSLDFGNLKLSAAALISPYSGEIVSFSGVLATPGTLADVHFEMPRDVESLRQCAAWIVWNLDQNSGGPFKPARPVGWVEEARANRQLLPWYKSRAEYEARPSCLVERKWLRLALNTLAEHVTSLPDNAAVIFGFDGSVLSIDCKGKLIVLAGQGPPWTIRFKVAASALRCLPRRLREERVELSIWQSYLRLGSWLYEGAPEGFCTTDPSRIQ